MPSEILSVLGTGLEFANGAKQMLSSGKSDPRLNDEICRALRTIYFTPNGIISLLKEIAKGESPAPDRIRQALIEFNDREWEVGENLTALQFGRLAEKLGLTLETARTLDKLRIGKLSLRREIQDEINYYGQKRASPDRQKVGELVRLIEQLNLEIETVERDVNVRARGR